MNLHDIAKEAGVSIATVSRVINKSPLVVEETRKKVQNIIDKYEYTPNALARGLIQKSTKTVGVLAVDIRNSYFSTVVHSLERNLKTLGYTTFLCNTGGKLEEKIEYIKALMERKVDGLVFVGSIYREKEDNQHIIDAARKVPVILLNNHIRGDNIFSILCDDYIGVYEATRYMIEKGRQNLIYVHSSHNSSGLIKRKGYRGALNEGGLVKENQRIINVTEKDDYLETVKKEYIKRPFDAIIVSDDERANQIINILHGLNINIPEQVSVIGYNNSSVCKYTYPSLSSVDSCMIELGVRGAELLNCILNGTIPEKKVQFLAPKLILRETT